jgi:hypothetical protein
MGGWVAPELAWMLWGGEKSLAPAGNQTLFVHPEAYHYTDSVILAPAYVTGDPENITHCLGYILHTTLRFWLICCMCFLDIQHIASCMFSLSISMCGLAFKYPNKKKLHGITSGEQVAINHNLYLLVQGLYIMSGGI